jgi:hypothetical protein
MEMTSAQSQVGRDVRFSYSCRSQPFARRSIIRMIEKLGGQRRLKALYDIYRSQGAEEDFFSAAVRLLDLAVVYDPARLAKVPRSGPVRLFQVVSHMSMTLRTALLFHETVRRIGKSIEMRIGEPIQARDLQALPGREEVLTVLRRRTYAMASSRDGSLPAPEILMRSTVLAIDNRGRQR